MSVTTASDSVRSELTIPRDGKGVDSGEDGKEDDGPGEREELHDIS